MKSGVEIIAEERSRQIEVEGFEADRDAAYSRGELVLAAICYASPETVYIERRFTNNRIQFDDPWPSSWNRSWDKAGKGPNGSRYPCNPFYVSKADALRRLAKAGALIAAEIDRIQNLEPNERNLSRYK
jgi:hypothetical protein